MSGAEDLARLTQTIDTANELFLSEEIKMVDVGGGVQCPTNAKVLADLSTQMSGALIYTSTALGLAGTPSLGLFSVLFRVSDEYIILYQNVGGVAVEKDRYPNSAALKNMQSLVRRLDRAPDYLNITDEEGGNRLSASSERVKTEFYELKTRVLNNKPFQIGGKDIGNSGLVDISTVAIYSVALTDAEIQLVAGVMRKRMARLGIAV
ncbi:MULTISPECIES: hypothetical protein [unclassified Pseudomonas]|uniref:hypothetical protein n=1 Tax=unclassified Pseudomonas TaxID=196821 RepID=UPI00257BFBD0|nr:MULTISPECIES: hypothetical protein [unclassified Pseudomonas]